MPVVNQHVVVGRRDVDAARKQGLLVLDVDDGEWCGILEETSKQIVQMTTAVLHHGNRNVEVAWQTADQTAERRQASPRCTDDHDRRFDHRAFR